MFRYTIAVVVVSLAAACSAPQPSEKGSPPQVPGAKSESTPTVPSVPTVPGPSGKLEFGQAPGVPAGFATAQALQQAWEAGQVGLVDTEAIRPVGVAEYTEIDYGVSGDRRLQLDVAALREQKQPGVVVLVAPPGCWSGADQRALYRSWLYDLAAMGCVAAVADYAGGSATKTTENLLSAARWLRGNAARYGGDPKRIVLMGFGDGAYAALMAAYTARGEDAFSGVVDFYGATDLADPCWQGNAGLAGFLGGSSEGSAASPIKHVTKEGPPTLILHAVLDGAVPIGQSDRLAESLQAAGAPFYYDRIEGWGRAFDLQTALRERARYLIAAFLGQYVAAGK